MSGNIRKAVKQAGGLPVICLCRKGAQPLSYGCTFGRLRIGTLPVAKGFFIPNNCIGSIIILFLAKANGIQPGKACDTANRRGLVAYVFCVRFCSATTAALRPANTAGAGAVVRDVVRRIAIGEQNRIQVVDTLNLLIGIAQNITGIAPARLQQVLRQHQAALDVGAAVFRIAVGDFNSVDCCDGGIHSRLCPNIHPVQLPPSVGAKGDDGHHTTFAFLSAGLIGKLIQETQGRGLRIGQPGTIGARSSGCRGYFIVFPERLVAMPTIIASA